MDQTLCLLKVKRTGVVNVVSFPDCVEQVLQRLILLAELYLLLLLRWLRVRKLIIWGGRGHWLLLDLGRLGLCHFFIDDFDLLGALAAWRGLLIHLDDRFAWIRHPDNLHRCDKIDAVEHSNAVVGVLFEAGYDGVNVIPAQFF